jgi:hypothetical protein
MLNEVKHLPLEQQAGIAPAVRVLFHARILRFAQDDKIVHIHSHAYPAAQVHKKKQPVGSDRLLQRSLVLQLLLRAISSHACRIYPAGHQ